MVVVFRFDGLAAQHLAITRQLIHIYCPAWDLADHQSLQDLAEFMQMGFVEQVQGVASEGQRLKFRRSA